MISFKDSCEIVEHKPQIDNESDIKKNVTSDDTGEYMTLKLEVEDGTDSEENAASEDEDECLHDDRLQTASERRVPERSLDDDVEDSLVDPGKPAYQINKSEDSCDARPSESDCATNSVNGKTTSAIDRRGRYCCPQCKYRTSQIGHLKQHISSVHLHNKPYKCAQCDFRASQKGNLKQHVKSVHIDNGFDQCPECDFTTNRRGELNHHLESVHRSKTIYLCPECSYRTNQREKMLQHVASVHRPFNCSECCYKAASRSALVRHINYAHGQKVYLCPVCNLEIGLKSSLTSHLATVHPGSKQYQSTEYKYKSNQKMSSVLQTYKSYRCLDCDYTCSTKRELKHHIFSIHTGEKPYQCPDCSYSTHRHCILNQHIKSVHLRIKIHQCPECSYRTNEKGNLNRHIANLHRAQRMIIA